MCSGCDNGDADDPVLVRQWLDQRDARLRETIREHGWAVQYVLAAGDRSPSLAYTVGLTGFDHPEIAVFGLGQSIAGRVLNDLGDQVRAGARLRDGDLVEVEAVPLLMFDLPNPCEVVFGANRVYGRGDGASVPALQAVYGDRTGTWPWEPGCELPAWWQPMPGQFQA